MKMSEIVHDNAVDRQPEQIVNIQNDEGIGAKHEKPENSMFLKDSIIKVVCSNEILVLQGVIATVVDPLFFYIPMMKNSSTCLGFDKTLTIVALVLRTATDVPQAISWCHSSRLAHKSLSKRLSVFAGIIALLPVTQVIAVLILSQPQFRFLDWVESGVYQMFLRGLQALPAYFASYKRYVTRPLTEAWFALPFIVLLSHLYGAAWYHGSVVRRMDCLKKACKGLVGCNESFLYCESGNHTYNGLINDICSPHPTSNAAAPFSYGIYRDAIMSDLIGSTNFAKKLFPCIWWALNKISSFGQNIEVGDYIGDSIGAIVLCLISLFILTVALGRIQTITTTPTLLVKWMEKRRELTSWPPFVSLPKHLRKEIIMYQHPNWIEESKVNLESLLNNIPRELKKKLKAHFCKTLFYKVKEFEELDGKIKEELRERVSAVVFQAGTNIYMEGYPIFKMIHIVQGNVLAYNNNDLKEGLPAEELKKDDSFGKELLLRALGSPLPKLPLATQTVQSQTRVEAFALSYNDFATIFTKYGRLFESYKEEWAANVITGAFRKYVARKKRKSKSNLIL